jgi:hypothetical protein
LGDREPRTKGIISIGRGGEVEEMARGFSRRRRQRGGCQRGTKERSV